MSKGHIDVTPDLTVFYRDGEPSWSGEQYMTWPRALARCEAKLDNLRRQAEALEEWIRKTKARRA